MKNLIILASFLILGARSLANHSENMNGNRISHRQNSGRPVTFTDTKTFRSSVRALASLDSPVFMGSYLPDTKNIHIRALKDFQVRFSDAGNVKWFSDDKGFTSYFTKGGYSDHVFYNKKGRWQYSLIYYAEGKLPAEVRAAVKSVYFDLSITLVEEVQTADGMGYVVHLEDKSNIKILKVNRLGEMEIMTELVKP